MLKSFLRSSCLTLVRNHHQKRISAAPGVGCEPGKNGCSKLLIYYVTALIFSGLVEPHHMIMMSNKDEVLNKYSMVSWW